MILTFHGNQYLIGFLKMGISPIYKNWIKFLFIINFIAGMFSIQHEITQFFIYLLEIGVKNVLLLR